MKITVIILLLILSSLNSCAQENHLIISNVDRMESDFIRITKTGKSRNYQNIETLDKVADYIADELYKVCDTVMFQVYKVNGVSYRNVIGSIGLDKSERLIIGAHYDVAGNQQGADDNGSGVVGVLELARILSKHTCDFRIDFVAYTLEEPPFFGTDKMGSYIHAESLSINETDVKGMICLEMIGYYDTTRKSQRYPVGFLKLFYGGKGDFITVVQKNGNGKFGRQFNRIMKSHDRIETKSFKGSPKLPGIDFSDHRNYWKFGYSAVMVTNTAFYRNPHYHKKSDTMETLDLRRMSLVIDEVYLTVKEL